MKEIFSIEFKETILFLQKMYVIEFKKKTEIP